MNEEKISAIIKIFIIILLSQRIIAILIDRKNSSLKNLIIEIIISIIFSIEYEILEVFTNSIVALLGITFSIAYYTKVRYKIYIGTGILSSIIGVSICLILFTIATGITYVIRNLLKINSKIVCIVIISIILSIIIWRISKIKRLKNGLKFLQNRINSNLLDIVMINISAVVILAYCLFGNFEGDVNKQLFLAFTVICIIMIIMIQKTLTLYYKQKLLHQTIEDYKNEIREKDKKIKELSDEKFKISKLNHEFYNRQKSLEKKVADYVSNASVETANELAITEQIADLSKEYSDKLQNIKHPDKLPTTEIEEIDDMFKYMQSECKKNNIEFKLQINGNIHHMINQIIPKDKLVTLIGDHLRDAIIAINSSNNSFKSIIAILGKADEFYEFCVFDTGIEFELETLLALGTKPITTHKDTGGTGYGFMTTFETLRETKGSLVIEEKHKMSENNYTKAVRIIFDGKAQYRISSYRMKEQNKSIL